MMDRYKEVMNKLLDEYKQSLEGVFTTVGMESKNSVNKTDSPIEAILYIQMKADIVFPNIGDDYYSTLIPQYRIEKDESYIRVDFLYQLFNSKDSDKNINLVIECDGHEFHEKTKEQAQKDKSRDRFLMAQGFYVMRFTGSEIYKNPQACTKEINDFISEKLYGEEIRALT